MNRIYKDLYVREGELPAGRVFVKWRLEFFHSFIFLIYDFPIGTQCLAFTFSSIHKPGLFVLLENYSLLGKSSFLALS